MELTVYAAASLTDLLPEVAAAFEAEHHAKVVFNFAGSNTLAQQLIAAPRADVFISASDAWMTRVEEAGLLAPGTRRAFLANTLTIIAHPGATWAWTSPDDLATLPYQHLALGDPAAVPAGRYAQEWLSGLPHAGGTLWQAVAGKVSPAPDVRAALAQVATSRDVIGIVYTTDYLAQRERVTLLYQVPVAEGPKIRFALAQLQDAPQPELAAAFLVYLASPAVQQAFADAGFTVLE